MKYVAAAAVLGELVCLFLMIRRATELRLAFLCSFIITATALLPGLVARAMDGLLLVCLVWFSYYAEKKGL